MTDLIPRTADDIAARIESITREQDFHGAERSMLLDALPWSHAKRFLHAGTWQDDMWEDWRMTTTTDVRRRAHEIAGTAWPNANQCKPTEASRSVPALRGLCWLLRIDVEHVEGVCLENGGVTYPYHGKLALVAASEAIGFPWRDHDDGRWIDDHGSEVERSTALDEMV